MSDLKIAKTYKMLDIEKIAKKLRIKKDYVEKYGNCKAKIELSALNEKTKNQGNLILVTATNPTKYGEGKTTVSIGLADSLSCLRKKVCLALREPSMGPIFGLKGGATGGGHAQVVPMEDINLHFTGDFHAITYANNLIAACIENHLYHGNKLNIEKVVFNRCLDINDRSLRKISTEHLREDSFKITAASEIMAILCLSKDMYDLRNRLSEIIIGYNNEEEPVYLKELEIVDSLLIILKDAIKPNLVQTLFHTPAFIHGGPFANIAHGCNSIIATKMAMKYADYAITEAGFGADLGAEKFLDIVCPLAEISPSCVVLVTSIRSLKEFGKTDAVEQNNISIIRNGMIKNLFVHYKNLTEFYKLPTVVALNIFGDETPIELEFIRRVCNEEGISLEMVHSYDDGETGAISLAKRVISKIEEYKKKDVSHIITAQSSGYTIEKNIESICKNIYKVTEIKYSDVAKAHLSKINEMGYRRYSICMAKTPYALNDGKSERNILYVDDIRIANGAKMIIIKCGNIMTMPGMPKVPLAQTIKYDIDNDLIENMI